MSDHVVTVSTANGLRLGNWSEIDITLDLLNPGSAWTLGLWHSEVADADWRRLKAGVRLGEQVHVAIDDAVQLSGQIEDLETVVDRQHGPMFVLSGRDLAGIALDWDADPKIQLRNATLEQALVALFEPLRYSVFPTEAAAAREIQGVPRRRRGARAQKASRPARLSPWKVEPGETVWQTADKICRQLGYLLWTAPYPEEGAGIGVCIDVPAYDSPVLFRFERFARPDRLVWDGNIKSSRYHAQVRDIPTRVTVFGHSAVTSGQDARLRAIVDNNGLRHPLVTPELLPHPRYIRSRGKTVDAARRDAERLVAEANATFRVYEPTVEGFAQNGRVFTLNSMARVRDDLEEPRLDEDMLITRVHFRQSREESQTTTLRLVPRGAIQVLPAES